MTGELSVDSVVGRLRGNLRTVADAHRLPNAGGLPESPGLYAWWMVPGVIHGVTGPSHPAQPFELLYVGIAPKDGQSRATLRSRIRGQHLGGNIGSSTFRQSLAALRFEAMGWTTRWSGTRAQLSPEDNRALSDWQREHLRLAWVECPRPWTIEAQVIALMQPPLNLADNASHPLYHRLKKLRSKLRDSAAPTPKLATESVPRRARSTRATSGAVETSRRTSRAARDPGHRSQQVTAKDIDAGQIRIPRGATKTILPPERQDVLVLLRRRELTCRWDPRYGPPERSGVIRVGKTAARELLRPGDVLNVRAGPRRIELD
jgi:hypothetical protein